MSPKLKIFLANCTLAAVALGLALGCAEALVRFVAPQQLIDINESIWQPADTLGYVNRPNLLTTINWGEGRVTLRTDREGFRISRAGRVEGKKHVLLLGDSFMEAVQVEYEGSLAGLLESRLSAAMGEPVAVRNTAVNGWDPGQYLEQARRALARDPFDVVLVSVFLGNDLLENPPEYYSPRRLITPHNLRWPRSTRWPEIVDALLFPVNDVLEQHSHLFVFTRKRTRTLLMRFGLTPLLVPRELLRSWATSVMWSRTADICKKIADAAAQHGVPALILLVPADYQVDPDLTQEFIKGFGLDPNSLDLDQPNRLLGAELAARRLDVIDVLPDMRAEHARGKRLYGRIDAHLTVQGHDAIERLIEAAMLDRLRRPTRGSPR